MMKTKIFAVILACVMLLTSCELFEDLGNLTDISEDSEASAEDGEASGDVSEEQSGEVSEAPNGIYSGQSTDTLGVEEYRIADFLEGSLFAGDSATDGFRLYVNNYGDMPEVYFFSSPSYGYGVACKDKEQTSVHPEIGGIPKYIWEAAEYYEAKRVFINLGLNDFGYLTDETLSESLNTICANIHSESPETEIVFLSSGFFTEQGQFSANGYSNDLARSKNEIVLNFCKDNGYDFIDVSWAYADANGNLIADYTTDGIYRLGYGKYELWEDILKAYAAQKLLNSYENVATMLK